MVGLQRERIAEVWATAGSNVGTSGSGYLIDSRHILTAAHIVDPAITSAEGRCEVRCLGQQEWRRARVVKHAPPLDLALLELVEASDNVMSPVRWGRIVGTRPFDCSAVGFPEVQRCPDGVRNSEQIEGRIQPLSMAKTGQLAISVRSGAPRDLGDRQTLWKGMSGAAVFANDVLFGVIVVDPQGFGPDRLIATAMSRVAAEPAWAAVFAQAGIGLLLEPVLPFEGIEAPRQRPLPNWNRGSPSVLLQAHSAVVPFRGRQAELENLDRWCSQEDAVPVRLLVGPGGAGKTRLAAEFCRVLTDRGWLGGFVSEKAPPEVLAQLREFEEPALLIVDYAETRADLTDLLSTLAGGGDAGRRRVLLLARNAGDWWPQLQHASGELEWLLTGATEQTLGPVDPAEPDRAAAFAEAAQAFTAAQRMEQRPVPMPDLSAPQFENILYVHMAALDAVGTPEEPGPGQEEATGVSVLTAVREREQRYWRRSAEARGLTLADRVLERVVLLATLIGADSEDDAGQLLRRVPDLQDATEEKRRALAWWYHELYTGSEWLTPLQPDALAEDLTAHTLRGSLARTAFRDLEPIEARRALTILDRTARRRPEVESALAEVLNTDLAGCGRTFI